MEGWNEPIPPLHKINRKKYTIMNVKKFILSCFTVAAAFSVNAQETKNEYVPNWYVMGQFGGQHTLGEVAFSDLNSLNAQIGVGYNFNKIWGTRLTLNGWQSKAGWETEKNLYTWAWNYVSPVVDVTANLSNLFFGYKPERLVNFGVFAGVGANVAFGNDGAAAANEQIIKDYNFSSRQGLRNRWEGTKAFFTGRVGANVDFRLSSKWTAGLEFQANAINDYYNSKRAGNADWYLNALVGVKYTFGSSNKVVAVPVAVPVEKLVDNKVNKVEKAVSNEIDELKKRIDALEDCCEKKEQAAAAAATAEPFRRDVFFTVSSGKISTSEMVKVKEVVEFMKKNPNTTVEVTGYADKGTGNPTINAKYAHNRAVSVVKALVAEGIAESRIKEASMGDKVQPYADPLLNRVAICIVK